MGKKKRSNYKVVEVLDVGKFTNDEQTVVITEQKSEPKINYDEILDHEPPYYIYMIDFHSNLTMDSAKKLLNKVNYISIAPEECQCKSFVVEFDSKKDVIEAHALDNYVIMGKSIKMSFISYNKMQEIRDLKFKNKFAEIGAMLSFRSSGPLDGSGGDAMESNSFSMNSGTPLLGFRDAAAQNDSANGQEFGNNISSAQIGLQGLSSFRNSPAPVHDDNEQPMNSGTLFSRDEKNVANSHGYSQISGIQSFRNTPQPSSESQSTDRQSEYSSYHMNSTHANQMLHPSIQNFRTAPKLQDSSVTNREGGSGSMSYSSTFTERKDVATNALNFRSPQTENINGNNTTNASNATNNNTQHYVPKARFAGSSTTKSLDNFRNS